MSSETPIDYRVVTLNSVDHDLLRDVAFITLVEAEGERRSLAIPIGTSDAVQLRRAVEGVASPRPSTHELLHGVLARFRLDVGAVRITSRQGSVYFAEVDVMGKDGRETFDCRVSDALSMAIRQRVSAPMLINAELLE
jgi:bifunctional DNase/RNase